MKLEKCYFCKEQYLNGLKNSKLITFKYGNKEYLTCEDCYFKFSSSYDPMTITVYESSDNVPVTYLLKKGIRASSGAVTTEYFTFNNAEKYKRIALGNKNLLEIISATDSDGNKWYEVDYLAQDTVFTDMENTVKNDDTLYTYSDQAPYLLKLLKTTRRFTTYLREDGRSELRFGAGTSDSPDEEIIPSPDNVGSSLPGSPTYLNTAFDPSNFLATKSYGQAPSNTQLTIIYRYGGGVGNNIGANSLRSIQSADIELDETSLNTSLTAVTKNSIAINNPTPAACGRSAESIIEVKNNALAYFQAQQRAVTKDYYIARVYALPPKYGNIAKSYIVQDSQLDSKSGANS